MNESSIAACVVCRNEGHKLGECLDSVDWTDEVLVLDLESTDDSALVAADRGATVVRRAPHPIVEPLRDEIASHSTCEWILVIDPDERVTPGLAAALRTQAQRTDIDAVVVPRLNVDFGWEPTAPQHRYEPQLRLYRRSAVRWPHFPNRLPDVPEERVARLAPRDDLVLRHLRNISVAEAADRLVRYAPAQAQAMYDAGQRFSASSMSKEIWRLVRRHLLDARAWEDGVPGLFRAVVLINHHVYVWIAFWQVCGAERDAADDALVLRIGRALRVAATFDRLVRLPKRMVRAARRRRG